MRLPGHASDMPGIDGSAPSLADWVEELADRIQAGEPVDLSALARSFPERAAELRRLLPAVELMAALGRSGAGGAAASGVGPRPGLSYEGDVLGDFRLVREVGRGGMGVVYEAEQLSLNRRVALKILPFAAALDPRQLQRFQLEAQAAACLHHTNIVPVHAVGSERGVPFYAMQFIEGRTLAQVVAELRRLEGLDDADRLSPPPAAGTEGPPDGAAVSATAAALFSERPAPGRGATDPDAPTVDRPAGVTEPWASAPPEARQPSTPPSRGAPSTRPPSSTHDRAYVRNVADLGLQAAEALDHAHARGILHRDIKPGNLMLDGAGHLWVTDFGLAQIQGDSRLTLSGDLLGTLRYMSPEQAEARRVVIDGRTDVYSLGVTLYELLTLRPAVDGRDRAEILRRVVHDEPTPPRRLNPSLPRDLETVVRKATAKEPGSRYATARELADDLRRFLEDRPIAARRPNAAERLLRWLRRHPSVAAATAAVLVLATLASVAATWLVAREQRRTAAALRGAELRLVESRFWNALAYQTSPYSRRGATVDMDRLLAVAESEVAPQLSAFPIAEARVRHDLGEIFRQRSEYGRAEPQMVRALALRRTFLGEDDLETLESRLDLTWFLHAKDPVAAVREIRAVLAALRRALPPDDARVIEATWRLASALLAVDFGEAVRLAEQTVEASRRVRGANDPVTLYFRLILAKSAEKQGQFDRAAQTFAEVHEAQVRSRGPLSGDALVSRSEVGWARWAGGDLRGALGVYQQVRDEYRRVYQDRNPGSFACDAIPSLLLRYLGEHRAAAAELEALIERWTRIKGEQHDYVLGKKGMLALDRGDLGTARRLLGDLWRRRDALPPPMCALDTGKAYAEALAWGGDRERAVEVAGGVLAYAEHRMTHGDYSETHYLVAVARDLMSEVLAVPGGPGPASEVSRALDLARRNVAYFPNDAQFRTTLGTAQYRDGRWDDAIATLMEAGKLDGGRRFAPRGFVLAMAFWQRGEKERAGDLFRQSADWMDRERPGHPELLRARAEAAALLGVSDPALDLGFPTDPFAPGARTEGREE